MTQRILITPGEPAGIGPDITLQMAQHDWSAELVIVADPNLLSQRAQQLGLKVHLAECNLQKSPEKNAKNSLKILPVSLRESVTAGELDVMNAPYVMETLSLATSLCLEKKAHALVTGPVHKAIINKAGIPFTGHTEFLANLANVEHTVMLFVVDQLKVALATTHLPIAKVSSAITKTRLQITLEILHTALQQQFHISEPVILVCGLNPHAGENGYLGREEIDVISPLLDELREKNYRLQGPLPADTIFTPSHLQNGDAVLAMYHDQALPVVKYMGFGHAVNVTLGLPFIRTSVDHGTALDIAGTGVANAESLHAAITLASKLGV